MSDKKNQEGGSPDEIAEHQDLNSDFSDLLDDEIEAAARNTPADTKNEASNSVVADIEHHPQSNELAELADRLSKEEQEADFHLDDEIDINDEAQGGEEDSTEDVHDFEDEEEEEDSGGVNKSLIIAAVAVLVMIGGLGYVFYSAFSSVLGGGSGPVQQEAYLENLEEQAQEKPVLKRPLSVSPQNPQLQGGSTQRSLGVNPSPSGARSSRETEVQLSEAAAKAISANTDLINKMATRMQAQERLIRELSRSAELTREGQATQSGLIKDNAIAMAELSNRIEAVMKLARSGAVGKSKTTKKRTPPTYSLMASAKGKAFLRSRKDPSKIVTINVGTNLIGYGEVTAISPNGEILTVTGPVKLKR